MPASSTADSSFSSHESDSSSEISDVSPGQAGTPKQLKSSQQLRIPMTNGNANMAMFFPPERHRAPRGPVQDSTVENLSHHVQQGTAVPADSAAMNSQQRYDNDAAIRPPPNQQGHAEPAADIICQEGSPAQLPNAGLPSEAPAASFTSPTNGNDHSSAPAAPSKPGPSRIQKTNRTAKHRAGTDIPGQSSKPDLTERSRPSSGSQQANDRSMPAKQPQVAASSQQPPATSTASATADSPSAEPAAPTPYSPTPAEKKRGAGAAAKERRRQGAEVAQQRSEAEAVRRRAEAEAARAKAEAASAAAAKERQGLEARQRKAKAEERQRSEAAAEQARQQYAEATRLANQDAAQEACKRAEAAIQSNSFDQADRLLKKASSFEGEPMREEVRRLRKQLQQQKERVAAAARDHERAAQQEKAREAERARQQQADRQRQKHEQQQQQQQPSSGTQTPGSSTAPPRDGRSSRPSMPEGFPEDFQLPESWWGKVRLTCYLFCCMAIRLVPMTLPIVARLAGWRSGARRMQAILSKGGLPSMLLWVASVVTLVTLVAVSGVLAWWAVKQSWAIVGGTVTFVFRMARTVFNMLVWRPKWWATLPLAGSMAVQRKSQLMRVGYIFPVIWLLARGGWWSFFSLPVVMFFGLVFCQMLSTAVAYVLLANSFTAAGSWWKVLWAVLVVLAYVVWLALTADDQQGSRGRAGTGRRSQPRSHGIGKMDPKPEPVRGSTGEVARVLAAEDLWEVLQVPRQAAPDVLRKAKHTKLLLVHPDKLQGQAVGAGAAFQRVNQAYNVLSNPQQCRQYINELQFEQEDEDYEEDGSPASTSRAEDSYASGDESMSYPCWGGNGPPHTHLLHVTRRTRSCARHCGNCTHLHPAEDGDCWLESTGFFSRAKVYTCLGPFILDITDMAYCQGWVYNPQGKMYASDTCDAAFHIGTPDREHSFNARFGSNSKSRKQKRGRNRRR